MAVFNDGDPIDAAQLGSLQTQINNIVAKIPQIGSSTTNINLGGTTAATVVVPQVFGGVTTSKAMKPGQTTTFTIDYSSAGLTANPKSITLTPIHPAGGGNLQAYIVDSTVGPKTAEARAYLPTGYKSFNTKLYFLVVTHN